MITEQQKVIIEQINNYKELIKSNPEIIYLIKKHKIEPYWSEFLKVRFNPEFWTEEIIYNCAQTCRNRMEFNNLFQSAARIAFKNNLTDKIMANKPKGGENYTIYNFDVIIQLCKNNNLQNFNEFKTQYPGPYQQAYQKKILHQIKDYFKEILKIKYSDDIKLAQDLKKNYPELIKMGDKEIREYFTFFPEKRLIIKKRIKSLIDNEKEQLKKDLILSKPIGKIKKYKVTKKNTKPALSKHAIRYSTEEIIAAAKKYTSRKEFAFKDIGAYNSACNKKILDEVCSHMEKPYESLGEQLVRQAFNYKYNTIFYKIKPDWLINDKTGMKLELDGFNDILKIAFEVNGNHHYQNVFSDDIENIKQRDLLKIKKCEENGIKLFIFEYRRSLYTVSNALHKELNIPKEWLLNVVFNLQTNLTQDEIKKYREEIKIDLVSPSLKEISYEQFAEYINYLRKQNLSNIKIEQVLDVSNLHLQHRITRINQLKIPLIKR